jgi:hypothetical protein
VSAPHEAVDQEGIFVAILSQGSWDLNMTKPATENLSERARQVAAHGQVFDVEYVNRIVERLDRTGIEAGGWQRPATATKIACRISDEGGGGNPGTKFKLVEITAGGRQ